MVILGERSTALGDVHKCGCWKGQYCREKVLEWQFSPKNLPREEYVLQGATLALLYLEHMALVTPAQAAHPLHTIFLPFFL